MKTIQVQIPPPEYAYSIHFEGRFNDGMIEILQELGHAKYLIVTDSNVFSIYQSHINQVMSALNAHYTIMTIPPGEKTKNPNTLHQIIDSCITAELDREDAIIALGGGVVGDLAGFAAAVYKRGISYVHIPTTLLAQVDSSVGGKVGINIHGYKNLLGSFHHPESVIIYTEYLRTLSERDFRSGMAEVIKYALILDESFAGFLNTNFSRIMQRDMDIMLEIIYKCCRYKRDIVEADEKDIGIRGILNFGHTIGHGLEYALQTEDITHGEAIGLGMLIEGQISFNEGKLTSEGFGTIQKLISTYNLNVLPEMIQITALLEGIKQDKKNSNGLIGMVFLNAIGNAERGCITTEKLSEYLQNFLRR